MSKVAIGRLPTLHCGCTCKPKTQTHPCLPLRGQGEWSERRGEVPALAD